jgi:hypothetical protein
VGFYQAEVYKMVLIGAALTTLPLVSQGMLEAEEVLDSPAVVVLQLLEVLRTTELMWIDVAEGMGHFESTTNICFERMACYIGVDLHNSK